MRTINGQILRKAIIFGTNELERNKEEINALNVFPVPDGDTGANMSMTAHSAANEVAKTNTDDVHAVAKAASSGALRGARGNSGVILSQLFRGFAKGLEGKTEVDVYGIAEGFVRAKEAAYKAVMKPKEGTILTVARAVADAAEEAAKQTTDIETMLKIILERSYKVLAQTEFMLQELKDAKVVDAGGKGLLYIIEGILAADYTVEVQVASPAANKPAEALNAAAHASGDIEFGYCTEMFIDLSTGIKKKFEDIETDLAQFLDTMGDSIVLVGEDDVVKIHIHTNNPGAVMEKSLTLGQLSNIKIDNMRLQHAELVSFDNSYAHAPTVKKEVPQTPAKAIGVIAVASGHGFKDIFDQLGVDYVIEGGQTMNPSTEDFLSAVAQVNATDIILLPNNSNIILAAQQAVKMSDKNLHVIPTRSVPEGISGMYALDPEAQVAEVVTAMETAAKNTQTGQVTFSIKDTTHKGTAIKKGDILSILGSDIVHVKNNVAEGAKALIETMIKGTPEFVNIYYGEEATEAQANELKAYIEGINKQIEVAVYSGGQSLYYYLISAE